MARSDSDAESRSSRIIGRRFRYTNDYKSVPSLTADGRRSNDLVYTGKWILPVNEESEYKRIVTLMRILLAVAAAAVIGAVAILPPPMTHKWYLPVLIVSFFPLAYEIMGAVKLPGKIRHMERMEYDKSFQRLGTAAMFAFVVICIAAVGVIVYWIIASTGGIEEAVPYSARDGVFAALVVVAAAAEFAIYKLYRRIKTETLENSAYRP